MVQMAEMLATEAAASAQEAARQAALDSYNILDTLSEREYDDVAKLAALICGTPIALISFVDRDRQWFKARIGMPVSATSRAHSFCAHAIRQPDDVMVVPDAASDPRFAENPLVTGFPRIKFYAGAPLVTSEGAALGTICVIDQAPRELSQAQIEALAALSRQVMALLELRRANAALEMANALLAAQSLTDGLTCIPNRRAFNRRLGEERQRAQRTGQPLSMLVLDVDHFKEYNDQFGHPAGDEALQVVARTLDEERREYDFCARYGGEEFGMILPNTTLPAALAVAERLRAAVAAKDFLRPLTVSIGVATAIGNAARLLDEADRALYAAKSEGRDRVVAAA
jgi:diguanylate cyclase (GGDEF)-like protein